MIVEKSHKNYNKMSIKRLSFIILLFLFSNFPNASKDMSHGEEEKGDMTHDLFSVSDA